MLTETGLQQKFTQSLTGTGLNMNKLCRQISIESPCTGLNLKDCVNNDAVPVPDVNPDAVRIRVVCVGACYLTRNRTSSSSSITSNQSVEESCYSPLHHGVRDSSLFAGYEVAGVVDVLGENVVDNGRINVGTRVVIYPYEGLPRAYSEYIVVPDLKNVIPIPDTLPIAIAAMLPSGALLAKEAVECALRHVVPLLEGGNRICRILIVGTGGLALWAIRIAEHLLNKPEFKTKVKIAVAVLKDEGYKLMNELPYIKLVQWNEDAYEAQIIERTKEACKGPVDIVIDFGTTSRSLRRSLKCLTTGGVVLVSEEVANNLVAQFSTQANSEQKKIEAVSRGTIEQLTELVQDVASGKINPPPHEEFRVEDVLDVVQKLSQSKIHGRAILRFDQEIQ